MTKRVLYSGFKWAHHDEAAGYNQIAPAGRDYVDGGDLFGSGAPLGTLRSRLNMLLIDLVTAVRGLSYDCVLIFYPEQTAYISPAILKLAGVRIVYSTHLDEEYWFGTSGGFSARRKLWLTKFVDHFIVLSKFEVAVFERRFPGRVTFIAHGVWCTEPAAEPPPTVKDVIVVGDNYRDYALMRDALLVFEQRFPDVVFHLVGVVTAKLQLASLPANAKTYSRLSAEDYRGLIKRCAYMFLPLTFATANNALLEAFCLGVPAVCNPAQGVLDYLPSIDYVVNDAEALAAFHLRQAEATFAQRVDERGFIQTYCRENFDWSVIRLRVQSLMDTL